MTDSSKITDVSKQLNRYFVSSWFSSGSAGHPIALGRGDHRIIPDGLSSTPAAATEGEHLTGSHALPITPDPGQDPIPNPDQGPVPIPDPDLFFLVTAQLSLKRVAVMYMYVHNKQ